MKKSRIILLILLLVLIGLRIYLPYWVTDYVNKVLDEVPGYSGSIEDVDLNLYRGAYKIKNLKMVKTDEEVPVPFLDIALIDLSVHWKALFNGRVVGEVELQKPIVNFVGSANEEDPAQTGVEADWTKPLKELMPLRINRFAVVDGKIFYKDFNSEPPVNIALSDFRMEARNLGNVVRDDEKLPSSITASATSIGGGRLNISCRANVLKQIPDFDLNMKFEDVDLPALNDFTTAYAKLDFEKGTFNLYSEIAVNNSQLEGYVKPLLTELEVVDLKTDKSPVLHLVWESIAGALMQVFENQPRDQFATKVPFNGNLDNPDTKIWPTIGNIFRNAFIKAFTKDTDETVSFDDVVMNGNEKKDRK